MLFMYTRIENLLLLGSLHLNHLFFKELEEYIATAYSSIRQEEAKANTSHSNTTVRTLLSILRISAALARLCISETLAQSDVDEALRLMQMSKFPQYSNDRQKSGLDAISDIYSIL